MIILHIKFCLQKKCFL